MLAAGIKGIINYTTMRFKGAENAVINNVYLQFELENVIYFTNRSMEK
jgi:NADH/NAD ratio-sensing transcriptional regulator Rex